MAAGEVEPGLTGRLLGAGGDDDEVGAGGDGGVGPTADVAAADELEAVAEVEHLGLDPGRVDVVERDLAGERAIIPA